MRRSRNSDCVSHFFWSTKNCCAIAVEPPKACIAISVKEQNRSQQLFGLLGAEVLYFAVEVIRIQPFFSHSKHQKGCNLFCRNLTRPDADFGKEGFGFVNGQTDHAAVRTFDFFDELTG